MDLWTSFEPLPGGYSGETFVAGVADERVVVRIYGERSSSRGPDAPEIDAAVLALVRGLVPVPDVLEVRRPQGDQPGLLVTSLLPGERLDVLLPGLGEEQRRQVAASLGVLIARLGHIAMPRPGEFADPELRVTAFPREAADLPAWVDAHADALVEALGADALAGLTDVADAAQVLLDEVGRTCLVHSDLNPKNVLVDPEALTVTGLVDWEFSHAGSPFADLGNLLRFERDAGITGAVLAAYTDFMPASAVPDRLLDHARAADLFALVDLAAREEVNPVVHGAREILAAIAAAGDVGAA